jgi:hypothetical protein
LHFNETLKLGTSKLVSVTYGAQLGSQRFWEFLLQIMAFLWVFIDFLVQNGKILWMIPLSRPATA